MFVLRCSFYMGRTVPHPSKPELLYHSEIKEALCTLILSRRGLVGRMLGGAWTRATLLERAALVAARARAQSREPLPVLSDIENVTEG